MRLIIGLTGAFGSGCSFIARNYFVKEFKYKYFSLAHKLREEYKEQFDRDPSRHDLQEYGNEKRKDDTSYLAKTVYKAIEDENFEEESIVIDSIRNPAEVQYFRKKYPEFILVGVFAEYDIRWDRVKEEYNESKDNFNRDENKDQGNDEPVYGQKISKCFFEADLIISNNDEINVESPNDEYKRMYGKIKHYIGAFKNPTSSSPNYNETLMAMAYAIGRRSKCIKRKVGAVIVDNKNYVLSMGFNSVPLGLNDCKGKLGTCYRNKQKRKLKKEIEELIKESFVIKEEGDLNETEILEYTIKYIVKKIKILELCRSLHAEESAILNLVGRSAELTDSTLYVTTYPCNLCANKIVQIGVKNVFYFEPYPVIEAKKIFDKGDVKTLPFEGVTFRAFFKAFNYEP